MAVPFRRRTFVLSLKTIRFGSPLGASRCLCSLWRTLCHAACNLVMWFTVLNMNENKQTDGGSAADSGGAGDPPAVNKDQSSYTRTVLEWMDEIGERRRSWPVSNSDWTLHRWCPQLQQQKQLGLVHHLPPTYLWGPVCSANQSFMAHLDGQATLPMSTSCRISHKRNLSTLLKPKPTMPPLKRAVKKVAYPSKIVWNTRRMGLFWAVACYLWEKMSL